MTKRPSSFHNTPDNPSGMLAGARRPSGALGMPCSEHGCIIRPGCPSPTSTPEELERRAEIQRNDLLLHEAVIKNDTEGVRRILREPVDINSRNNKLRSSLHAASERGHTSVAEYLLNHEGHLEARDADGNTPLCVATQNQQLDLVRLLLDHGADPDAENSKGFTPLHIACSLGSKGIIEALVQHGALLDTQNKLGSTPLHLACQSNTVDVVEFLIAKGADLNALNQRLQSPMHIAAELGHVDICKLLLAAGANIEQREQGGRTPLYIAARGSFTAIVDMIIKTARLDYPPHEDDTSVTTTTALTTSTKKTTPVLNTARLKMRSMSKDESAARRWDGERFREILFKLSYKQLGPGEWKRLAHYWAFTEEQIRAIEHQYTGPSSYKEHGFRMMLIWVHGLPADANPIKEIYEGLTAIDKRPVADALRRKLEQENEERRKGSNKQSCASCSIT